MGRVRRRELREFGGAFVFAVGDLGVLLTQLGFLFTCRVRRRW